MRFEVHGIGFLFKGDIETACRDTPYFSWYGLYSIFASLLEPRLTTQDNIPEEGWKYNNK
jgi:hypothetical protein